MLAHAAGQRSRSLTFCGSPRLAVRSSGWHVEEGERLAGGKNFNHKVEKPIFMRLRGPKALDDKGHEGKRQIRALKIGSFGAENSCVRALFVL
jgi:hypothetical protein